jgi:Xaa-Pro aminopeptidase
MTASIILARLQALQTLLANNKLDGFLIPHNDPHQNEYIPTYWDRRTWICGFDGSNGDLLVMQNQIILWTDGRYTLQAQKQLAGLPITILEQKKSITQDIAQWLLEQNQPYHLGVDPQTISLHNAQLLSKTLHHVNGKLIPMNSVVDSLWLDKPKPLKSHAFALSHYPGMSARNKIQWLLNTMLSDGIKAIVLNTLDDIAWLFNIRGHDIPYSPVCISYALITTSSATWFVDLDQIDAQLKSYCESQNILLQPYTDFQKIVGEFEGTLGMDHNQASWWMAIQAKKATIESYTNPIILKKSTKTDGEIAGIAQAHQQDAIALIQFLFWLETHWQEGITEWDAAKYLNQCRFNTQDNQGLSFNTISGFGSNGAIVHYRVEQQSAATIDDSSFYLIDSGGQYTTGTTDVTRVVHLGVPTAQQKCDYTLVLKGHIDLAKIKFPKGTTGTALDAIARQYLWNASLNFSHGTGHGVGYFLNVHEGPCRISPNGALALQPGMVLSNEPGLYREGAYGIRIENLQAVVPYEKNTFGEFYQFKTLTLVPYARHLIEVMMLTENQIQWINDYHHTVYNTLSPHCSEPLKKWLKQATLPL